MNIVLIGYRGSGKSAAGRALAERLDWPLVDTDRVIEQQSGQTIREIFAARGEPAFRDLEAAVIAEVVARDSQVISAGGGAILREANVQALKQCGRLVWLTAPAEVLWARIESDTSTSASRPNLTAAGGLEEVRAVLERRTPLYQASADLVVDTAQVGPEQVADAIIRKFGINCTEAGRPPAS